VDLLDVGRICARRWYIFVPIMLLAVLASILTFFFTKPVYSSNAAISIALPSTHFEAADPGVGVPRNGLIDAGGALLVSNLIAASLNEDSVHAQVVAAGGKDNYTAKMFPTAAGVQQIPVVMIEAVEPDPASASKTVELVAEQARLVTKRLQQAAGVPVDQMVTTLVVSPPSRPVAGSSGRLKATLAILLIGVAAAVLAAVITHLFSMRRKSDDDPQPPAVDRGRHAADDTATVHGPMNGQHAHTNRQPSIPPTRTLATESQ
jgi:capsular polysaccharide biosynthesis protein